MVNKNYDVIHLICVECDLIFPHSRDNSKEFLNHFDKDNSIIDQRSKKQLSCPKCDSKQLKFKES